MAYLAFAALIFVLVLFYLPQCSLFDRERDFAPPPRHLAAKKR